MITLAVATERGLWIARRGTRWTAERHLEDQSPDNLAVDHRDPSWVFCGSWGGGLWRSADAGRTWNAAGSGIASAEVTAVAVARQGPSVVYAGTEPSAVFRSDDGGETWRELSGLLALPSSSTWAFPPRPETHHVRWIETDPDVASRVFVAIEAGALVHTPDGGATWIDRAPGGPIDTHTAATHAMAPGRLYSAAGDGYFESDDAGATWTRIMDGLRHRYLVGVAVDPADPGTVVVSGASGPRVAYRPQNADAHVYRRAASRAFEPAMEGLPSARGTTASRFATAGEPGVFYAANNHGVFRSADAGRTWTVMDIPWPAQALAGGVDAVICIPE